MLVDLRVNERALRVSQQKSDTIVGLDAWKKLGYDAVAIEQRASLNLDDAREADAFAEKRKRPKEIKSLGLDVRRRITVVLNASAGEFGARPNSDSNRRGLILLKVLRCLSSMYDIVAVEPTSQESFGAVMSMLRVPSSSDYDLCARDVLDIIAIDVLPPRCPFRISSSAMLRLRQLGVFVECRYRSAVASMGDKTNERVLRSRFIGNGRAATAHISKGHMKRHGNCPNFILSSGAHEPREARNAAEVCSMCQLIGLSERAAQAVVFSSGESLLRAAQARRTLALPAAVPA